MGQLPTIDPHEFSHAEFKEDGLINVEFSDGCILGVVDGVDAFHSKNVPRKLVHLAEGVQSRAQYQVETLQKVFALATPASTLRHILHGCTGALAANAHDWGISLDRPDDLPGIDVAVVKIDPAYVTLVQMGGDAIAVWETVAGEIGVTPCQGQEFSRRYKPEFDGYVAKSGVTEAWIQIETTFRQARMDLTNTTAPGAHGTMNGQAAVATLWVHRTFMRSTLRSLFLVTDGIWDFHGRNEKKAAIELIRRHADGGWQKVLEGVDTGKGKEGTGIAITF